MAVAPRGFGAYGGTVAGTDVAGTLKVAAFMAEIIDTLGEVTETRDKIEFTNSASPADGSGNAYAQFNPGDIVVPGEYELTIVHDTQKQVPWGQPETIVITYPKRGTAATAATISFQGFLSKHVTSMPFKDKMMTKLTFVISGVITRTIAS